MLTTHSFQAGDRTYSADVTEEVEGSVFKVRIGDKTHRIEVLRQAPDGELTFLLDGKPASARVLHSTFEELAVSVEGTRFTLSKPTAGLKGAKLEGVGRPAPSALPSGSLTSHIPGRVIKVSVEAGGQVNPGDVVVVLESMKMEASIRADRRGRVKEVRVKEGSSVSAGDVLVVLE